MSIFKIQYPLLLSVPFRSSFIQNVLTNSHHSIIRNISEKTGLINYSNYPTKLSSFFDLIYKLLKKNYRCEYIYKNEIINQLLLSRHSFIDTNILMEFRVFTSKADVVILNGTSNVYEIKTELDTLSKLESQLTSYKQLFDKIHILTNNHFLKTIEKSVSKDIGILLLNENSKIETIRESSSHIDSVNPSMIFKSLRKDEHIYVIKRMFGEVPNVPNAKLYEECFNLFKTNDSVSSHKLMLEALQLRKIKNAQINLLYKISKSLKAMFTGINLSVPNIKKMEFALQSPILL